LAQPLSTHTGLSHRAMNAWTWGPSLIEPRYRAALVAIGCAIYCVGGLNDGSDSARSTLEILDPRANTWRQGAPKPTAAASSTAVMLHGRRSSSVGMIRLETRRTSPLSNLMILRAILDRCCVLPGLFQHGCCGLQRQDLCFGGNSSDGLSSGYVYHPSTDHWSPLHPCQ